MAEPTPIPGPRKARPDPRPMRLALAAGAVAAASIVSAGVALPQASGTSGPEPIADERPAREQPRTVERAAKPKVVVHYVHLKPGQKAPKGARVIHPAAPPPRVVVVPARPAVHSVVRPAVRSAPIIRRVVTHTRQSGRR